MGSFMKKILILVLMIVSCIGYVSADVFSFGLSPKVTYNYNEGYPEVCKGFEVPLSFTLHHNVILVEKSSYFTGRDLNSNAPRESVNFSLGMNGGYRFQINEGSSHLQVVGGPKFTYRDASVESSFCMFSLNLIGSYVYLEASGFVLEIGVELTTCNYKIQQRKLDPSCQISIFTTLGYSF